MKKPLVSIIVPTYNVERYARKCFDSLINQTLTEIEIILVDDGSTDSSGAICDEYAQKDDRVRVIHQSNKGLGLSRNSGIYIAEGEYIGFVDSDDFVLKDMFYILYSNAKKYEADISYCKHQRFIDEISITDCSIKEDSIQIWQGEKKIRQYLLDRIGLPPDSSQDNFYGACVCGGIFSRKLLSSINAKFVSERKFIAEDIIFDIDVIPNCCKIIHSQLPMYCYRYNSNSLTTVYKPERFEKNIELYHEMYRRLDKYYDRGECFNSMSRYLLTFTRIAIIQEVRFVQVNGKKEALNHINRICSNDEVRQVLGKYDFGKLPLKYRITCLLILYKKRNGLLWLYSYYIKSRRRKNVR